MYTKKHSKIENRKRICKTKNEKERKKLRERLREREREREREGRTKKEKRETSCRMHIDLKDETANERK